MKISVVSIKGGAGKTTTTMFLAAALKARGGSVLVVDTDGQGSSLDWATKLDWDVTAHPKSTIHKQEWLTNSHDHVVIDTPPADLATAASAMRAADLIVIPLQPTGADFAQFAETAQLVEDVQAMTDAPAVVLLTRVVKRTVAAAQVREALEPFGIPVLAAEVPQSQSMAMAYGREINDLHAYEAVLSELEKSVK